MLGQTYVQRRGEIEHYFDRTAAQAWARLTSDAPLGRIRATVREGRDRMRATLLSWLPENLHGLRILDAGCGTGALALEAARRGAQVLAIDLSPTLVSLARERCSAALEIITRETGGSIDFRDGDMLDAALGGFDHVVAMDSFIHYGAADVQRVITALAARTTQSMVFTFAPRTPLLALMHTVGKAFPRSDRSPAIVPLAESRLRHNLHQQPELSAWTVQRSQRVNAGFYISQALELQRTGAANTASATNAAAAAQAAGAQG